VQTQKIKAGNANHIPVGQLLSLENILAVATQTFGEKVIWLILLLWPEKFSVVGK
jgi:hypothetical protein